MRRKKLAPTTPGEILQEEFLTPLKVSQYRLAKEIGVPPRRINEIVQGKRAVAADTAIRLARHVGTSERFRLNLQTQYDLELAKDRHGDRLSRDVQPRRRYYPPRVFLKGKKVFLQMPDGKIEQLTPKANERHFAVLTAYLEAQGKLEKFFQGAEKHFGVTFPGPRWWDQPEPKA